MIIRGEITKTKLLNIYDTCNRLFKQQKNCFYTEAEIKKKKLENKNVFLGDKENGNWRN